jgi:hypothetical protein
MYLHLSTVLVHKPWLRLRLRLRLRLLQKYIFRINVIKEMVITLGIMVDRNAVFTCCISLGED